MADQDNDDLNVIDPDKELKTKPKKKAERNKRFKVILFNDDDTPMELVVKILREVFRHLGADASRIMLSIHRNGSGVAGVYDKDTAETKQYMAIEMAKEQGFALRVEVEEE